MTQGVVEKIFDRGPAWAIKLVWSRRKVLSELALISGLIMISWVSKYANWA